MRRLWNRWKLHKEWNPGQSEITLLRWFIVSTIKEFFKDSYREFKLFIRSLIPKLSPRYFKSKKNLNNLKSTFNADEMFDLERKVVEAEDSYYYDLIDETLKLKKGTPIEFLEY